MAGQDFQVSITGTVTGFDVAPITNMNNALKQVPPAAQQASTAGQGLNTSLAQVTNTSRATGTQFQATGSLANNFGNSINTARGSAQQLVGTNGSLGNSFGGVASGGLNANNTLNQLGTGLNNTTTAAGGTERSSISLGQKIALMGGFITSSVGSVFGLIEGFTGLEAAQVAADRAQQRVNTSSLAAEKAQDSYNKMVDKFGPSSRQAQEALANLQNKNEANRIAEERSQVTQSKLNEAYVSFGLEVVTVAGEMAQMGSTVSILVGKLGTHAAAAAISADASAAEGIAAGEAGLGLDIEALAADNAAKSTEATGFAALGLGAKFALIATPLIAAAALFLLIETNTFGLGDAFRTITPQIGSAIDAIVNGVAMIYNAFIKVAEVIVEWGGNTINTFLDVYNAVNTFLDQVVVGFTNLGIDIQNALTKISVFFANNLIIPITNAWGVFNQGFKDAWQATVNTLVDLFKPAAQGIINVVKTIVDAAAQIPGAFGDPFRAAQKEINNAVEALKNVGTQAGTSGKQATDAFTPIPPIVLKGTDEIKRMTTSGLFPLSNAYVDVTGTIKQLDSGLITNAGNIKTGAEGFLNYYSHINNVSGALKSNLSPALQASSKFIQDNVKELTGWFTPASAMENETKKIGGEIGKTGKEVKTFSETLTENTTKQNENAAAMLKSITTGQQHAKTLSDLNKSFADITVKIADLTTKLTDATAIQQRHSIAVAEGTAKALEFGIKIQDDATITATYNKALEQATGFSEKFGQVLPPTTKNLEDLAKALAGDGKAAEDFMKAFIDASNGVGTASQKLVDDVSKAFDDLGKSVKENKALKEIPKDLRKLLDPQELDLAFIEGAWKGTVDKMAQGVSLAWRAHGQQFNADGIGAVQQFISGFADSKALKNAPEVKQFYQTFADVLATAKQQGGAAGEATIVAFLAKIEAAGGGAAAAAQKIAEQMGIGPQVATLAARAGAAAGGALANGVTSGTGVVPGALQKNVIDPFTGLPTTAQAVATKIATAFNKLGTAFDQLPGYFLSIFTKSFVTNLVGPLGKATTSIGNWINSTEAAFSNMVTTINNILAGIKPPTIASPVATGPVTTGPTQAPAPIKIPAPDLTAYLAGLARMEAATSASAQRIIQMFALVAQGINTAFARGAQDAAGQMNLMAASIQSTIANVSAAVNAIPIVFNTAFSKGAQDAAGQMNLLAQSVQATIANISAAVTAVAIVFNTAFSTAAQDAAGQINLLAVTVQTDIANMAAAIGAIPIAFNVAFNTAAQDAAGLINQLAIVVETDLQNMIAATNAFAIAMTTNFNTGAQNAAGSMNALAVNEETNIQNMIAATNAFAIAITSNFNKGAQNAAGSMNALAVNEEGNIANMIAATNAFAIAITSNFSKGASNAAGSMNSLATNVSTNVNNMITALNRVITEFNNIKTSISNAASAVDSLISRIKSIPTSVNVNVNIIEHITQVVTVKRQPITPASIGTTASNASGGTTTITTLSEAAAIPQGGKARVIRLEISEPTIVKIDGRELIKQINKKLLELDIGALV